MKHDRLEIQLPAELKQDFESVCKKEDKTMSVKLREMIEELVRKIKRS
jgi:predicted DNA-binding protein